MERILRLPSEAFFREFVPDNGSTTSSPNHKPQNDRHSKAASSITALFGTVSSGSFESLRESFMKSFNTTDLCPGHTLVPAVDEHLCVAALYPSNLACPQDDSATHWATLEASILFFPQRDSPFSSPIQGESKAISDRRETLQKRFLAYAGRAFARQQRTHLFMAIVVGDLAHLVRCDREAVFFTPSFQYKAHPKALVSFFSRFATMSPRQRGFDPTPTVLTPGDPRRRLMQDMARSNLASRGPQAEYARQCFENALDPAWPWYSIPVDGREFLVGKPHVYMEPLLGRPSRGYVALRVDQDCYTEGEGSPFVWLKDTWRRVRNSEYEREGSIIGDLNRCGVRGVPTLICHEDVLDHKINLSETADRLYGRVPDPTRPHIELIQYRMVIKEVGVPVEEFRDSKELVEIVLDCVTAHRDAYQLAGILHRDISPGNLLMVHTEGLGNGDIVFQGILTDWELAERIARRVDPGFLYQPRRRGTWEFLSLSAMNHPEYPVQPEDDVESFVHVLLSFAIAYLPHNCVNVHDFDSAYFFCEKTNSGSTASTLKRRCLTSGRLYLATEGVDTLTFLAPDEMVGGHIHSRTLGHPLNDVFRMLLSWTRSRYAVEGGRSPGITRPHAVLSSSRAAKENMNTHEGVGSTLLQKTATAVRRLVSPLSDSPRRSNEHAMPMQGYEGDGIKVDAHDAMMKVLSAAIAHGLWPLEDKTADQLES